MISLAALIAAVMPASLFADAPLSAAAAGRSCRPGPELVANGNFQHGTAQWPDGWTEEAFGPSASFAWDRREGHSGNRSVSISAETPNDASWVQSIAVEPRTLYLLTGWIRTEDVAHSAEAFDAGANLSILDTWEHSQPLLGTSGWTREVLAFNSGGRTEVRVAARLGFYAGTTTGVAWFDDISLRPVTACVRNWSVLVLVYAATDVTAQTVDGHSHHFTGAMTAAEEDRAVANAREFVTEDFPRLDSGYMVPTVTVRRPGTLTRLEPLGGLWWPAPEDIAPDRDPAFDAVISIWDASVVDESTGEPTWIGAGAGMAASMGMGQTYAAVTVDYANRNVFKHEMGHVLTYFYDATGTAPRPTVEVHAAPGDYVHCPTGAAYVWEDETAENPIPNSIYNDDSGFTHDYYSGTTATADQPTRCLGITEQTWRSASPTALR